MDEKEEKKENWGKSFTIGMLSGLLLATVAVWGVFIGRTLYEKHSSRVAETAATGESGDESVVNQNTLSKMISIEDIVEERYYLDEISVSELEEGVCDGMIEALGDKYAAYYTAEELSEQLETNEGSFYGIGAYISIDEETETPFLSGIIEGTPAQEAGLRTGDIIYAVDGERTYQMTLDDIVARVKGEEGTKVVLTVIRGEEVFDQEVVRRKVDRPTVSSEMLENNIGYIQITEFKDVTVDQFTENYAVLKGSGMEALIIDLRGNPGGVLDAVVDICRQILPKGLVVYTENKAGERKEYSCDGKREIQIPLVVLVNGGSASAAEVMTGAIKDYGIGTIIGTTTYGKGIVQKIISLADGSAVKLTTDAYFTPNGNNIHGTGIAPDIEVEFDAEAYYGEEAVDNQLEAAKEYLEKELGI